MLQYCHCGARKKFADMYKAPAPKGWGSGAAEVWMCPLCNNPSHAVQEIVVVVRGPKDVRQLSNARILQNGQHLLEWRRDGQTIQTVEFRPYPKKVPMSSTEPLIFQCWNLLMSKVPAILTDDPDPWSNADVEKMKAKEQAKFQARGIAETLAILMQPFLSTGDEVVRAAVKKYKNPDYEVPGLGEHLWDPMKMPDGSPRVSIAEPKSKPAARPKAAPKAAERQKTQFVKEAELSEADKEGICAALESGMFEASDLASMYKVNESTILALK